MVPESISVVWKTRLLVTSDLLLWSSAVPPGTLWWVLGCVQRSCPELPGRLRWGEENKPVSGRCRSKQLGKSGSCEYASDPCGREQMLTPSDGHFSLWQENLGLQEGTHELCYNAACALIGQGQLTQAMKILQKAEGWELLMLSKNIVWDM